MQRIRRAQEAIEGEHLASEPPDAALTCLRDEYARLIAEGKNVVLS